MKSKGSSVSDLSTEAKIMAAARVVFYKKGFAATRTRDIAEEAGINLALLNYYFRSKAKLFDIIMLETVSGFIQNMVGVLNNEKTTLEEKIEEVVSRYIDVIINEPEIPTFIVTEIRNNPALLLEKLPIRHTLTESVFIRQYQEAVLKGKITEPNPLHFLMNMMGLIIFPFIAKPLLMGGNGIKEEAFNELMRERKKKIPVWIKAIMKVK